MLRPTNAQGSTRRMMKPPCQRVSLSKFSIPLCLSIVSCRMRQAEVFASSVAHSRCTLSLAERMLSAHEDGGCGVRGYVMSSAVSNLRPFIELGPRRNFYSRSLCSHRYGVRVRTKTRKVPDHSDAEYIDRSVYKHGTLCWRTVVQPAVNGASRRHPQATTTDRGHLERQQCIISCSGRMLGDGR